MRNDLNRVLSLCVLKFCVVNNARGCRRFEACSTATDPLNPQAHATQLHPNEYSPLCFEQREETGAPRRNPCRPGEEHTVQTPYKRRRIRTQVIVKKVQKGLHFRRSPRKFATPLNKLYRFTVLSRCTMWCRNYSARDHRVVNAAQSITQTPLPSIDPIDTSHCVRKATNTFNGSSTPPTLSSSSFCQEDSWLRDHAPPNSRTVSFPLLSVS
ncbi:uncharacterized protein [Narcine bancroftii]|uniref:uncharacterized protein n=1 Tax=Narcine bancroftii TaxID=1343680 RepID=UPI00383181C7